DEEHAEEHPRAVAREELHAALAGGAEPRGGRPGPLEDGRRVDAAPARDPLGAEILLELAQALAHEVVVVATPGVARDEPRAAARIGGAAVVVAQPDHDDAARRRHARPRIAADLRLALHPGHLAVAARGQPALEGVGAR